MTSAPCGRPDAQAAPRRPAGHRRLHHGGEVRGQPRGVGHDVVGPSRAVATVRSSATSQSAPTPRQSHWNTPRGLIEHPVEHLVGLVLVPAVREEDGVPDARLGPAARSAARWIHAPIAVPPPACRSGHDLLGPARVFAEAERQRGAGGYTTAAPCRSRARRRTARRRGCSRWRRPWPPWPPGASLPDIDPDVSMMMSSARSPGAVAGGSVVGPGPPRRR